MLQCTQKAHLWLFAGIPAPFSASKAIRKPMENFQPPHARCAQLIYDGFTRYNKRFKKITDRARWRFEHRDWKGQIGDIRERVELYETWVQKTDAVLREEIGPVVHDREFWEQVRFYFGSRLENVPDAGFMKTFYNSITRRLFGTVGTDSAVEFVQPPPDEGLETLTMRRYPCWGIVEETCTKVLKNFKFKLPYLNRDRDAEYMAAAIRNYAREHLKQGDSCLRFEFVDSHFFQGARAYLVGRILHPEKVTPIVVALENTGMGVQVDAVLMDERAVSVVFSYTRSYYFADPTSVVAAVQFLHSILPRKPLDELYTVLGRLRQGKTERYRLLQDHLRQTDDLFVHAAGDAGLVMIVFTLPSFNLVFKVMRDRFGYPKNSTHREVEEKYELVSWHDHAGRLIDTQRFRNLELPLERFSPELLEELRTQAAHSVREEDGYLVFDHSFVERRVRPLNLYVREVSQDRAEAAILDYGRAIKDLADTNIFPGDLLLKNFGVTASGRVVFYDYDEVALITDCRFREIPDMDDEYDTMHPGAMSFLDENDIFPEEFIKFLSMDASLRKVFTEVHGDLLTADYWREVKNRRKAGEITPIVPYRRQIPQEGEGAAPAQPRSA
ncbi:MAG: bifunctional isocitrate dehydrogenase kinase/phosphatase [Gammaproteobacteria bacterium]